MRPLLCVMLCIFLFFTNSSPGCLAGVVRRPTAIGFFAQQLYDFGPFGGPWTHLITWSEVLTNVGNAYNSGYFTAPVDGLYAFHVTLVSQIHGGVAGIADLMKNNQKFTQVHATHAQFSSGTLSAVMPLRKGDRVSVRLLALHAIHGNRRSQFSGFLITEM